MTLAHAVGARLAGGSKSGFPSAGFAPPVSSAFFENDVQIMFLGVDALRLLFFANQRHLNPFGHLRLDLW